MIISPRERAVTLAALRHWSGPCFCGGDEIATHNGTLEPMTQDDVEALYDKLFVELPASKDEIVMEINKELLGACKFVMTATQNWPGTMSGSIDAMREKCDTAISKSLIG